MCFHIQMDLNHLIWVYTINKHSQEGCAKQLRFDWPLCFLLCFIHESAKQRAEGVFRTQVTRFCGTYTLSDLHSLNGDKGPFVFYRIGIFCVTRQPPFRVTCSRLIRVFVSRKCNIPGSSLNSPNSLSKGRAPESGCIECFQEVY